jgi:hypothetical protein
LDSQHYRIEIFPDIDGPAQLGLVIYRQRRYDPEQVDSLPDILARFCRNIMSQSNAVVESCNNTKLMESAVEEDYWIDPNGHVHEVEYGHCEYIMEYFKDNEDFKAETTGDEFETSTYDFALKRGWIRIGIDYLEDEPEFSVNMWPNAARKPRENTIRLMLDHKSITPVYYVNNDKFDSVRPAAEMVRGL